MKSFPLVSSLAVSSLALLIVGPGCTTTSDPLLPHCDSGTGTIALTIDGLPSGVTASVTVSDVIEGPFSASTLVQTSGMHTITAPDVFAADPIVRSVYRSSISVSDERSDTTFSDGSVEVCSNAIAQAKVHYELIPTSNKIWWGNENGESPTIGYSSEALSSPVATGTGNPLPTIRANTAGALPGAFDKDGNLWVIDGTAGEVGVLRYPASELATSGDKTADIVLKSAAFEGGTPGPSALAFDGAGNLWVSVVYSNTVLRFDTPLLKSSATITPGFTITNVTAPKALAFATMATAHSGDLWVGTESSVVKFSSATIGASSSTPDLTIEAKTPDPVVSTLTGALGLAFDSSGNLWANYGGTFVKIPPSDLAATGSTSVTPAVQIKTDVLALAEGIAFDESGSLWFGYSQGKFGMFGVDQLAASGSLTPKAIVTSAEIGSVTSPAFFPAPANVPLYSSVH